MAVYILQVERLLFGLEDDGAVPRVYYADPLGELTFAFAPPVHDEKGDMDRREFARAYRLEQPQEHEFAVILAPDVITQH
jgi:hypothetical protein